jgi:hypothetical protein
VEAINDPNFELMIDFYHLASEHEDPAIVLKANQHIRHLHMANPQGRVYPAEWGEFDYGPFFANLKKIGYDKRISIEGTAKDFPREARAIALLRRAFQGSYSARKATSGSIRDARIEGTRHARLAISVNTTATPVDERIERGDVEEQRLNQARAPAAPTRPIARPIATSCRPLPMTRRITCPGCAPRAMRMPSSGVRCETAYASTEYSPTADSAIARPAKIAVNDATMRCAPRLCEMLVSSVAKNEIG